MSRDTLVAKSVVAASLSKKEVVQQRDWWKVIKSHARRLTLEFLNIFFNHNWLFWIVGMLNKRLRVIESVFLVYPANSKYALEYVYSHRIPRVRWNPWPCGLLWQNGKLTIMFCVSATNKDYIDSTNVRDLRHLTERMEKLRQLIGANSKTFAGILPGILFSHRIVRKAPEADLTSEMVSQAIAKVMELEALSPDTQVIVLGGRGFIGRRVVRLLDGSAHSLDRGNPDWPYVANEHSVIAVNVMTNGALEEYIDVIPPSTVVLNEVYPEPKPNVIAKLKSKGCSCYHVVGVRAIALPSFPHAYRGGIPCCAAWPAEDTEVIVRKL